MATVATGIPEGINAVETGGFAGNADNGKGGVRGDGTGQMGGHTGGGDDGTEAICPGVQSKLPGFLRRPVGGIDVTLVGNA